MENLYIPIEKDFLSYLKLERGLSDNTLVNYSYDLKKFFDFISQSDLHLADVKDDNIREFIYSLHTNYSAQTQSRILSTLNSFFTFLLLEEIVTENPLKFIEHPKMSRKLPTYLSVEEVELLLDNVDRNTYEGDRNYVILEVLYSCGLRVSEAISLKMSDLFFDEGFIRILGKGNKQRLVPIAHHTISLLKSYLKYTRPELVNDQYVTEALFLNRRGKPLTRAMIFTIVKQTSKLAGINKDVSPHTLRHSFATHMLENGADLFSIQAMLGHESITTTEIYLHIEKSSLKRVIEEFHPWVNNKKRG